MNIRFLVERGSRWLKVRKSGYEDCGRATDRIRGAITSFSGPARERLLRLISRYTGEGQVDLVTLTMPRRWPESPAVCAALFRTWTKRLRRKYPECCVIWKREWQRRGAPHWHLMVIHPVASGLGLRCVIDREWLSASWNDVVAPGDADHLRAGTKLESPRSRSAFTSYMAKELGKSCQDTWAGYYAERYGSVGRTWGVFGAADWVFEEHELIDVEPGVWTWIQQEIHAVVTARGVRAGLVPWSWTVGWTLGEGGLMPATV